MKCINCNKRENNYCEIFDMELSEEKLNEDVFCSDFEKIKCPKLGFLDGEFYCFIWTNEYFESIGVNVNELELANEK